MSVTMTLVAMAILAGDSDAACCLAHSPASNLTVYGKPNGEVRHGDQVLYKHSSSVVAVAVSHDGGLIASCSDAPSALNVPQKSRRGQLIVWDMRKGREVWTSKHQANGLAFSPDGKRLAVAGHTGVTVLNATNGNELLALEEINRSICVAFSPDGNKIAVGGDDVWLFEAHSGKSIRRLTGVDCYVRGIAFTSDSRRLVTTESSVLRHAGVFTASCVIINSTHESVTQESQLKVWELATATKAYTAKGPDSEATGSAVSPSGRFVAFASGAEVLVHDLGVGKCIARLRGHKSWVQDVAFNQDGKRIISGGSDGVKSWDLDVIEAIAKDDMPHRLLNHLEARDGAQASRAIWGLVATPDQAVALLSEKLRPMPAISDERLGELVANLESNQFAVRQGATAELEKLERMAAPALQKLLASRPPLEVGRRAEQLLGQLEEPNLSPELLRSLRGVEVLERISTPESRNLLERLAEGHPAARLTQEAKAALARMKR